MNGAARASATTTDLNSQRTKKPRIGATAHQNFQWQSSATLTLPNLQDLSLDTDVVLPDVDDAARNRYQTVKVLGFGTYAHVEEVYDKREEARLAMKVFRPKGSPRQREQVKLSVQKEVAILRRILGHRHIVNLHSAFAHSASGGPVFYVLVEPVANCDLGAYYENCALQGFPEHMTDPVREWFSCLAFGLEYIHDQKIRHKDIKPHNILVCKNTVLFADFGLAKDFGAIEGITATTDGPTLKTPLYAAPEVHEHDRKSYPSDVFSLGCVFAELLCLLAGESVASFYEFRTKELANGAYTHAFHETTELVSRWLFERARFGQSVVMSMLCTEPESRLRANELQDLLHSCGFPFVLCTHGYTNFPDESVLLNQIKQPVDLDEVYSPSNAMALASSREQSPSLLDPLEDKARTEEPRNSKTKADKKHSTNRHSWHAPTKHKRSPSKAYSKRLELEDFRFARMASRSGSSDPKSIPIPRDIVRQPVAVPAKTPRYTVILLGDGGVGKSALVTSFISGKFRDEYDPTIGDTYLKSVCIEGQTCLLQIIDTAGQEVYAQMSEDSIPKADAFIIVYDISRDSSFQGIVHYFQLVCRLSQNYSPRRILLVGAMKDLVTDRQVSAERALGYAKEKGCGFLETSAKLNENVEMAFHQSVATLPEFRQFNVAEKAPI